jgi:FAD-dependent urate hydroxylase
MAASGIAGTVGAGPYGLFLAAFLAARQVPQRIFDRPTRSWQWCMPPGIFLKSDGASSGLSHPDGAFSIKKFHVEAGPPFRLRVPIFVVTVVVYGRAFQRRHVLTVDTREVVDFGRDGSGYTSRLTDGQVMRAARVAIAVGVAPFARAPARAGPDGAGKGATRSMSNLTAAEAYLEGRK